MASPNLNVDEIVSLLTEMYTLILRFQALPEDFTFIHGPHGLPDFDATAWTNAGMDPETVNILSKLPFFNSDKEKIGPDMDAMLYLKDTSKAESDDEGKSDDEEEEMDQEEGMHLKSWTDPFFLEPEDRYIEPWCIPLTSASNGGYTLILDCKTSKL